MITWDKARLVTSDNSVDLPVRGTAPHSPYQLQNADGLGPPELNAFTKEPLAGREIVLRIKMNPDYSLDQTVADLREGLYAFLTNGDEPLKFALYDAGNEVVFVYGDISKFEIVPFSKDTLVQVTMTCDDPYLRATAGVILAPGNGLAIAIDNPGSAPSGIYARLTVGETLYAPRFVVNDQFLALDMALAPLQPGDELYVETTPDIRDVYVVRNGAFLGERTSLLHAITEDSVWPELRRNANVVNFKKGSLGAIFTWTQVKYFSRYWGV